MIIDGVILAGGQSSRMGQDKALLTRDHRDMFFYTLDTLESLPLNDMFISRNPKQVSYLTRHKVIADEHSNQGPLGGIHAVAQHSHAEALLIVPIDLPLLEAKDLIKIMSMANQTGQPVFFEHHFLPILLPLNPEVRGYLTDVVSGRIQSRSVKALCKRFNGIEISPDNVERLQNTNTPEQWLAAKLELMEI